MTFLGWLRDPFKWLSDLQLGDERITLNHLEGDVPAIAMLQMKVLINLAPDRAISEM